MKNPAHTKTDERFQIRDREGPAGVTLSSFKTREEADVALAARIAEAVAGERPLIADVGVQAPATAETKAQTAAVEAGKTAEEKAAAKASHHPPPEAAHAKHAHR